MRGRKEGMETKHTPGKQVAIIYIKGGEPGNREVVESREFETVQQATNWITPYIMRGHPFDICSADYLNAKAARSAAFLLL